MKISSLKEKFNNSSIRSKLLLGYTTIFILFLFCCTLILYPILRETIRVNIENNLNNTTNLILNTVKTTANASVRNYLRAVAEKNKDVVEEIYTQFQQGLFNESEAKQRAEALLLSQRIGSTGYIYCLDSNGFLRIHPVPSLRNTDVSENDFVQEQITNKNGYLEYAWKNPGEQTARFKALYMTYFEPWDWIISASSYRDEFDTLINVEDFRKNILSIRFGESGHSYIINSKGDIIVHNVLTGNFYSATDADGYQFIKEICDRKNGMITYSWKNPGEDQYRKKFVVFNYIPEFDWIVASASYEEEFFTPLTNIRKFFILVVSGTLFFFLLITVLFSSYIVSSLNSLLRGFQAGSKGDYSVRIAHPSRDEFGKLAEGFNTFMERLETHNESLKQEISLRKEAETKLQATNERYRSVLHAATEFSIIGTNPDGIIETFNKGAEHLLGYHAKEVLGKNVTPLLHDNLEIAQRAKELEVNPSFNVFIQKAKHGETETREWTYIRKDQSRFTVQLSVTPRKNSDGNIIGFLGIGIDITERRKTEKALKENELKYKRLAENSPGVVFQFMMKPDGTFSFPYANERLYAVTGIFATDLMQDASIFLKTIHPDDSNLFQKTVLESAYSLKPYHTTFRCILNQKTIWIEVRSTPERMPDNSILWDGFFIDVTERKQQQESLLRTQFAMDRARDGILWIDGEGHIVYANNSACASMGYTREELLKKKVFEIDPDFPPGEKWEQHKQDMRRLGSMIFEGRHITKDGRIFPVEVSSNYFEFDNQWFACAFDRDISDRKHAEDALKRSHEELETRVAERTAQLANSNQELRMLSKQIEFILGATKTGLDIIDSQMNLVYIDPEWARIYGDPNGRKCYEYFMGRTDVCPGCGAQKALETKKVVVTDEVLLKEGDRPIQVTTIPFQNEKGDWFVAEVNLDISERKSAEENLRKAYDELKIVQEQLIQSEKMATVGQLAAGVAHEINNPAGFVISNLDVLKKYIDKLNDLIKRYEKMRHHFDRHATNESRILLDELAQFKDNHHLKMILEDLPNLIAESADGMQRIKQIVSDLRSFSHSDDGALENADVHELIQSALTIVGNELKYKAEVVKQYSKIPKIRCYPQQLSQVFLNLLVNAAQAITAKGKIEITTSVENEMIVIKISDNGCGMTEEVRRHLFEPFFTTKAVGEGTGLGLSLAYNIIKNHKGEIFVSSEFGKGSTFIIRLPIGT